MHVDHSSSVRSDEAGASDGHDVVVVGAGIAGLTAALTAARSGLDVMLLDSRRPGGRARVTVVDPGVSFNDGPRALYRGGPAMRVLHELGIRPVGPPAPTAAHGLRDGVAHPLPDTATGLLRTRLLCAGSKLRTGLLLAGVQRIEAERHDHMSVDRWLDDKRLAPDARDLVRTIIRLATYVADTQSFSAGVAIRQLQRVLDQGVLYLDSGFQQLVDSLVAALDERGVPVLTGDPVRAIEPTRAGPTAESTAESSGTESSGNGTGGSPRRWTVRAGDGVLRADAVIVAAGGPDAADSVLPVPVDRCGLGPPAEAACLELALRTPPDPSILLGIDDPMYLSTHSPPADLAPDGITVVHVARYGVRTSDEDRAALWAHASAAGITERSVVAQRFLHRMTVMGGIPIASAGGLAGRPAVAVDGADGCFVAGDWVGDEGLLADASFASGQRAAQLAVDSVRTGAARGAG